MAIDYTIPAIEATNLPEPLTPSHSDLRDFPYMPLDVLRLRDAGVTLIDAEAFRAAVISWCVAWHQMPAASLPDDDTALCRLLGYGRDLKGWQRVRNAGALHGYVSCSDGRLYHPVVAEKAIEAMEHRLDRKEAANNKTERQRRWRERLKHLTDRLLEMDTTCPRGASMETLERLLVDATRRLHRLPEPSTVDGVEIAIRGREEKGREQVPPDPPSARKTPVVDDSGFILFWAQYPRKDDKGHARKAWLAAVRKVDAEAILRGLRAYQFTTELKFLPLAATWLNGERWGDVGSLLPAEKTDANPRGAPITPITGTW